VDSSGTVWEQDLVRNRQNLTGRHKAKCERDGNKTICRKIKPKFIDILADRRFVDMR